MKIAQVVCVYPPYKGGIGKVAFNFKSYLEKSGFESEIYTPLYKKEVNILDGVHRLKTIVKFGNAAFLPQLLFLVRKLDILILHYPFFGVGEFIWLAKILNPKLKLVIHYHMDSVFDTFLLKIFSLPNFFTKKLLFSYADLVTCASLDYVKESSINKVFQKHQDKFFELPFSVNVEKFSQDYKIQKEEAILFVGGLDKAHYFKGVDVLIDAFCNVSAKNKFVKLKIVGKGELKNEYLEKVKKLNLENRVEFLENVDNDKLIGLYNSSSVLVLPSINKSEAFGIVLVEAMACGLPIIATKLPGVRTVFEDKVQGLLVNVNDSGDLSKKIIQILDDKALSSRMSEESRKLVLKKYDENMISKKFVKIIADLYEGLPN